MDRGDANRYKREYSRMSTLTILARLGKVKGRFSEASLVFNCAKKRFLEWIALDGPFLEISAGTEYSRYSLRNCIFI